MEEILFLHNAQNEKTDKNGERNPMAKKSETFWDKLIVILAVVLLTWELRADDFMSFTGEHAELFEAVRKGELQELESLIARGKNIFATKQSYPSGLRSHRQTLLHEACKWNRLEIIEYLISRLDVNIKDELGITPLMVATVSAKSWSDDRHEDFNSLTASISSQKIRYLLSKGANPFDKSESGMTLLHYAAMEGLNWFVEDLIDAKIDPNTSDSRGWTPLHFAVTSGHKHVVEILIRKGANLKAKTEEGFTLIHLAVGYRHADLVQFLIQNGADVNAKLFDGGETPLHIAVNKSDDPQIVRLLLANGALPNIYDFGRGKNTPLYIAVKHNFVESAKILLEYGADPNIKNGRGESPSELAKKNGVSADLFKNNKPKFTKKKSK
ncbi:ankyrin repeat domain-containing protein [Leptospira borgpetersenii]